MAEIMIPANQWTGGAGTRADDDASDGGDGEPRDVTEIDTSSADDAVATAVFSLVEVPSDGVMIEIEVRLDDAEARPGALSVAVNDAKMRQPVDLTASGDRWGVVEVSVPAEALTTGNNRIVATAIDPSGNADGRAIILLGDITVRPEGVAANTAISTDGAARTDENDGTGPIVVDEDSQAADTGQTEPTIAPR